MIQYPNIYPMQNIHKYSYMPRRNGIHVAFSWTTSVWCSSKDVYIGIEHHVSNLIITKKTYESSKPNIKCHSHVDTTP